jgi:NAD(P)-dependent dehydrogenase (short-subunit alcohol dehydrogenase family)
MYGAEGIRCNAVAPGLVMSDIAREALSDHLLAERAAERLLPWPAEPEDIAGVACWLPATRPGGSPARPWSSPAASPPTAPTTP